MSMRRSVIALATLSLLLALAAPRSRAQEDHADDETAAAPAGPPTTRGRDEATAAVGQAGMTFELGSGFRVFVPAGLPIGDSRRMRVATARAALNPAHVAEGFRRVGPIVSFDGAINATRSPVVISLRQPRDPGRPDLRLVLAMEQATICREGLDPLPNVANLCSGWELVEATWTDGRIEARLPAPGGYRLVFGTVPVPAATEE
ncbi:hypothetical protein [Sandaracinus amylolyticus]|uniref:hypothetical protein n=1 Tax=Sandaracinus amylolyticus TaxID=927083 RepID=UPI001F27B6E3|nr:hypothetical protein [Sandaracinus amylolyticus]UJR86146.1 Hypothetical protein I5071_82280 [Sandaracinus amylolyticus]